MPPPWRRGELCGVHGLQRQAGASPFLSDNIHDDCDPAEDSDGGLSYGDDEDDVDDKE